MCSPTDIALLNDAQAARTRIEMELQTLSALLERYDTPGPVLTALRRARVAANDTKDYQAALYRRMAETHKARIER